MTAIFTSFVSFQLPQQVDLNFYFARLAFKNIKVKNSLNQQTNQHKL
jgi:hypothetical protein